MKIVIRKMCIFLHTVGKMENKSEISAEKLKRNDFVLFKTQIFISPINKN